MPAAPASRLRPTSAAVQEGTRTIAGSPAPSAAMTIASMDSIEKKPCSASRTTKSKPARERSSATPAVGQVRKHPRSGSLRRTFSRNARRRPVPSFRRFSIGSGPDQVELQHLRVGDLAVEVLAGDLQVLGQAFEDQLHADGAFFGSRG